MNYYVIKYFEGFKTHRCLVVADCEAIARTLFFKSHPRIRDYNVMSVGTTTGKVYQLAG